MDAFPGNPIKPPTTPTTATPEVLSEPVFEKVVTGEVVKRKLPLGRRMANTFFKGDTGSVGGFVLKEVVVPTMQELLLNVVNTALSRSFGMEIRINNTGFSGIRGGGVVNRPINYSAASTPQSQIIRGPNQPVPMAQRPIANQPSSLEIPEVIYEDEINAMELVEQLYAALQKYQLVKVANLYQLMGKTPTPIDYKFGWDDLESMSIRRIPGIGYMVLIPQPKQLR